MVNSKESAVSGHIDILPHELIIRVDDDPKGKLQATGSLGRNHQPPLPRSRKRLTIESSRTSEHSLLIGQIRRVGERLPQFYVVRIGAALEVDVCSDQRSGLKRRKVE